VQNHETASGKGVQGKPLPEREDPSPPERVPCLFGRESSHLPLLSQKALVSMH
jgi:hypothetical protein